jgi:hypothetical protein
VGGVISCSTKPENIQPPTNPVKTGAKADLSGEISLDINTNVYIGNGSYGPYTYLWNKTPTKPLTLFFAQDPLIGTNKATVIDTLMIQPDRKCKFDVAAADVPVWFDGNRDFIAGAIDVTSVDASNQWTFTQPTAIDVQGQTFLPMYFPLKKVSNNKDH